MEAFQRAYARTATQVDTLRDDYVREFREAGFQGPDVERAVDKMIIAQAVLTMNQPPWAMHDIPVVAPRLRPFVRRWAHSVPDRMTQVLAMTDPDADD